MKRFSALPCRGGSIWHASLLPPLKLLLFVAILCSFTATAQIAPSVWNGPKMVFTKADYADFTLQENQDRITPTTWITRQNYQGLYNAYLESGYNYGGEPSNTEWAYGTLDNYASLTYQNWTSWNARNPSSMVGRDAVLHLIAEDIYIGIKFLSWSQNASGGGFSYERTTGTIDTELPLIKVKDITVALDANGNATVTPAAFDNGTTDNSGNYTLSFSTTGKICATSNENGSLNLTAPVGTVITAINFASYGMPNGTCGNFSYGTCHAANSKSIVEGLALNKNSVAISAINDVFGDPCSGTVKRLYVEATYGTPQPSLSFTCSSLGTQNVTIYAQDATGNIASEVVVVTVVDNIAPTITAPVAVSVNTDAGKNTASGVALGTAVTADNCAVATTTNNAPATYALGNTTVTWTVTDAAGNTATATQVVTVTDTDAPVPTIATLPTITGQCDATVTAPTATDKTAGTITGTTTDPLEYTEQGTYTINWTYTDGNGNTATQTQQVIVKDETAPVFATVAPINQNNDANKCGAVVTYTLPSATDNCSAQPDPNAVYQLNAGDAFYDYGSGTTKYPSSPGLPYTFMPTQGSKMAAFFLNGGSKTQLYQDVTLPATGPVVLTLDMEYRNHYGSFDATNQYIAIELRTPGTNALLKTLFKTNPGDPLAKAMTAYSFDISEFAGQQVRVIITDATIMLNYVDILIDNVSLPGSTLMNGSFENDYTGWTIYSSSDYTIWGIGSKLAPPVSITQTAGLASGSLFPVGTTTNTFVATDAAGNTSTTSFDVTVTDTQKPTVVTQNITVNLDATGAATITAAQVNNGSTDNCSIPANGYSLDITSFTCDNVGPNAVTLTVTDANGNTSSATATVTVKDITAPTAKAKNITVQLDATGNATIAATDMDNGSSDLCGAVTLALSKTAFDCTNLGTNTVTLTVTDASGNVATTTATVTVEDKVVPVALAKDITVQLDATGNATITAAQVNNNSTDNCTIKSVVLDKSTFDCSNIGANTVLLTVTDNSGNVSTATATVTIEDKVAPIVAVKNITVQLDATGSITIAASDIDNGSTDNCGIASVSLSQTTFDCANIGANTVTLTVKDVNDNVSSKTATVTVEDKIAPIALTKNITVKLDATGNATIVAADVDNGSSDVCGSVTLTLDKTAFDCTNIGENTVTLTVTDAKGNVAEEKATVTIVDDLAPTVITQNIIVSLDATGKATITTSQINNGSSDSCGIAGMTLDVTDFTCENVGVNTVTLSVTDVNGNVATGTATVTIVDEVAPAAFAKNITAELDANGSVTITAAQVNDNSSDNCGVEKLTLDTDTFGCSNLGENTVTLTVTDKAGNKSTATAIVTIVDNIAPTITAPANVVVDVDAGKNTASNVNLGTPVTADNCSVASVTNDAPTVFPTGITTVTWTVTDESDNITTVTQTVSVRRDVVAVTTPATISVPIRTAYAALQLPVTVTVTYSDGSTEAINVNWAQDNYNGMVAGNYSLTGTLVLAEATTNTTSLKASITVVVEPNKSPTALAFNATTFKPDANEDDVIGTLTTTDPDDTEFVYSMVHGAGDTDNMLFEIVGDKVYLKSNNGLSGKTTFSFRVRSTDPYQNTIEKSFTLTKGNYGVAVDKLKIVNAFSPNGDGINDNWTVPELRFYNNVEIEVFDRSGVRLFHTTDPEMAWDGRSSNGQILKGAFFFIVQVKDINLVKKGVVTILKK